MHLIHLCVTHKRRFFFKPVLLIMLMNIPHENFMGKNQQAQVTILNLIPSVGPERKVE